MCSFWNAYQLMPKISCQDLFLKRHSMEDRNILHSVFFFCLLYYYQLLVECNVFYHYNLIALTLHCIYKLPYILYLLLDFDPELEFNSLYRCDDLNRELKEFYSNIRDEKERLLTEAFKVNKPRNNLYLHCCQALSISQSVLYSSVIHHWNRQLKPYWFPLQKIGLIRVTYYLPCQH